MGALEIQDLILKTEVENYVPETFKERVSFLKSGAMSMDLATIFRNGGNSVSIPYFESFTGADFKNDGTDRTPNKWTSRKDVAVVVRRYQVFSMEDAVKAAIGAQDRDLLTTLVSNTLSYYIPYVINDTTKQLAAALFDGTDGCLRTNYLNKIAVSQGNKQNFGFGPFVETTAQLGDNRNELVIGILHPYQVADLQREEKERCKPAVIQMMVPTPDGSGLQPKNLVVYQYEGRILIEDDKVPTVGSGKYKQYLATFFRTGCLHLSWQRDLEVKSQWVATSNTSLIGFDYAYSVHLRGTAFSGVVPSDGCDLTDVADPTKWIVAANANLKDIGAVACLTNSSFAKD